MSNTHPSTTRRTVLTTVAAGTFASAGCTDSRTPESAGEGALSAVRVEGTDLVIEYDADTSATGLAVIAPSGEAFAERELTPGASQATVPIGTTYPPGTYTVQLVDADSVVAAVEQPVEPEVVIRELKLARNHPEEMYEDAADFTITSEVMLTIENVGTGPEKLTKLQFIGDIPRPTPDDLSESGIAAVDQPVTYAKPVIDAGETQTIYSITFPFASGSNVVSCTPEGTNGEFSVRLAGYVAGKLTEQDYTVTYRGEDHTECDISVERIES